MDLDTDDSPISLSSKLKNKMRKSQKERAKSRLNLSFGADDDEESQGEVFKIKKSNLSKKMSLGRHPSLIPLIPDAEPSSNSSPKYDAAYLQELKRSTPSAKPPRPHQASDPYDADMSMDISMSLDENEDMSISLQDLNMLNDIASTSTSFIPSESSIKVAKEKRERLRQTEGASNSEEFISLSVVKRDDEPQGPHPESRLVREEDEIGEGEDEFAEYTSAQERIALGKKSRKVEASKKRENMKEMIADAEEEDEETMEWEQEQLRRGGHRPEPSFSKPKAVYKPAPIPSPTPVPILQNALARLSTQISTLTSSHLKNSSHLSSFALEQQELDEKDKEMRVMVEKAEEKRAWFSGFSTWIEAVAGFLDEKYPMLEKLEEEHLSLLKERFDMIGKRRREDDEDDLATFIGPLSVPPPSQEDDDDYSKPNTNTVVDRRIRRVSRTARRQIRSSRRPSHPSDEEEEEGFSTDSTLPPPDASAYKHAIHSLYDGSKEVLSDVDPKAHEFRDPGKGRFGEWREKYPDSYIGAWGGLGIVSVWEFWARLECVGWDCIEKERSLHSFKWYKGLYEYSRPRSPKGEASADSEDGDEMVEDCPLGPDGDLVASMISTAIIPILCKTIDNGALNVYSSGHIRRMIDLAEEVEASVESEGGKYQNLLKSVMSAFQEAISETESLISQYTSSTAHHRLPGFNPDAIPSRKRFLNRRLKLLKNLLRWRKYTGERFGLGMLATRLVERCVIGVAKSGWEVGGGNVVRNVLKILPDELVPSELKHIHSSL